MSLNDQLTLRAVMSTPSVATTLTSWREPVRLAFNRSCRYTTAFLSDRAAIANGVGARRSTTKKNNAIKSTKVKQRDYRYEGNCSVNGKGIRPDLAFGIPEG